jgi:hypothetical protein
MAQVIKLNLSLQISNTYAQIRQARKAGNKVLYNDLLNEYLALLNEFIEATETKNKATAELIKPYKYVNCLSVVN